MNDQEEKLHQEILADARQKAARIIQRAERDVKKNLDAVKERFEQSQEEKLAAAQRQAEEEYISITASIEHEIRSKWLQYREEIFDDAMQRLLHQVENGIDVDKEKALRELTKEALQAVGPGTLCLELNMDDCKYLQEDIIAETAAELFPNQETTCRIDCRKEATSGPVLSTKDSRLRFDNSYRTRIKRLKNQLRIFLGQDFDLTCPQMRQEDY